MTIFGRFGVDLGSLLEVIFGHVGAFFGSSWFRNRLRTVLSSKQRFVTKPSEISGCNIYGKAEFLNPGQSVIFAFVFDLLFWGNDMVGLA